MQQFLFFLILKFDFSSPVLKIDIKSRKIMTTSASILCPANCFSNVTIKAAMDGNSIKYIMRQPFSALQ